jgi:hypothetical protein
LKQIRIPTELAGKRATVLRESQTDKESSSGPPWRLQQQQMLLRSRLDRVYEDRLSDAIPEELWNSNSAALQDELRRVRTEMERHEVASQAVRCVYSHGSRCALVLVQESAEPVATAHRYRLRLRPRRR